MKVRKFSFGKNVNNEFTNVKSSDEYDTKRGYGFLGISDKSYTKVVDGYFRDSRNSGNCRI